MRRGRSTAPPAAPKPADASTGAPFVRKFMLKLFDREDGTAAGWPLIAETLLREAFHALDQVPDDPRVLALLRRVNAGTYDRLAGNGVEDIHSHDRRQAEVSSKVPAFQHASDSILEGKEPSTLY